MTCPLLLLPRDPPPVLRSAQISQYEMPTEATTTVDSDQSAAYFLWMIWFLPLFSINYKYNGDRNIIIIIYPIVCYFEQAMSSQPVPCMHEGNNLIVPTEVYTGLRTLLYMFWLLQDHQRRHSKDKSIKNIKNKMESLLSLHINSLIMNPQLRIPQKSETHISSISLRGDTNLQCGTVQYFKTESTHVMHSSHISAANLFSFLLFSFSLPFSFLLSLHSQLYIFTPETITHPIPSPCEDIIDLISDLTHTVPSLSHPMLCYAIP